MPKPTTKKIIYSPQVGIGFSTANPKHPECIKDAHLAKLIDANTEVKKINRYLKRKYGKDFDCRGVPTLDYIELGIDEKFFIIDEYSGWERVVTEDLFMV